LSSPCSASYDVTLEKNEIIYTSAASHAKLITLTKNTGAEMASATTLMSGLFGRS